MINWIYFPRNQKIDMVSSNIIISFENIKKDIDSETYKFKSDEVLAIVRPELEKINFIVEKSKQKEDKINVPVLFGVNGKVEKTFNADAYCHENKYIIEVEAGRAVVNYQFLKDFFEACAMYDIDYLCIAVRNTYNNSNDFEKVRVFFDALYQSNRINVPLKGLLIIGY